MEYYLRCYHYNTDKLMHRHCSDDAS